MPSGVHTEKNQEAIAFARQMTSVPWCDDYEKMISGMLYSCLAPELEEGRFRARKLAAKFNTYVPPEHATLLSAGAARTEMLKEIFGRIGDNSYMEPGLQVDYGCNISIGDRFYANFK